jgi:LmbE family N-acetylglucosaminyl deacetylase
VRIDELGTVLGVWAPPDDEAYLAGGVMAMARAAGSRVVSVTATSGERGTADPQVESLAAVRILELARSLEILGVVEHHALGLPDGGCADLDPAGPVARLAAILDEVAPDTVLTFGPDGLTGHPDHQAVSAWTGAAFAEAAPPGARLLHATIAERRATPPEDLGIYPPGYPIRTPDGQLAVDLALAPAVAARKTRALAAQATQTTGLIAVLGVDTYTAWVGEESFVESARLGLEVVSSC